MMWGRLKHISRRGWIILIAVSLLLVFAGVILYVLLGRSSEPAELTNANNEIVYSTATPDESKDAAGTYNWQGSGNDPKKIRIASIGVDAYIQRAGIDQDGSIAVPTNIHLAGWFVDSVRPGQRGLSIIDGHVNGLTQKAIFADLASVVSGDTVEVETGSEKKFTYEVMTVTEVPLVESASLLYSQDPNVSSQLNLITCGGVYDSKRSTYNNRVIVTTRLKQDT